MNYKLKHMGTHYETLMEYKNRVEQETGRKVALLALVGSWHHHLATDSSDFDLKCFVYPDKQDLLNSHTFNFSVKYPDLNAEGEVKDVRLLFDLLVKQNPNYLDCLAPHSALYDENLEFLFDYRDFWYSYNPPKCFAGCMGWLNRYLHLFNRDLTEENYPKLCKLAANMQFMQFLAEYLTMYCAYPAEFDNERVQGIFKTKQGALSYEELKNLPEQVEKSLQEMKEFWDTWPKDSVKSKEFDKALFQQRLLDTVWNYVLQQEKEQAAH